MYSFSGTLYVLYLNFLGVDCLLELTSGGKKCFLNLKNQNEARLRAFNSNYALLYILNRKTALVLIEFSLNRNCLLEFSI